MEQGYLPNNKKITKYYPLIIAFTSFAALAAAVFCIINDINIIYLNLFYIPIVIASLCYPKKGVSFSLLIVMLYIFITTVLTDGNTLIISENLFNSVVFIGIAGISSVIAQSYREDSLKYQRLLDNSGAATAIIDKNGKVIHCNADFENITGYSKKELKRKIWTDIFETGFFVDRIIKASRAGPLDPEIKNEKIEARILNKNGQIYYTLASVHTINELYITLLSLIDISEKIEAENVLRINEERYKKLFQQSTDAIFISSAKGKIYDANNRACTMTGYPLEELRQINVSDLFLHPEWPKHEEYTSLLKKKGSCCYESRFVCHDNTVIDVDIRSVIIDSNTDVAQTIIRDITLRKKNDNALAIASKKLSLLSSITRHDILNQVMVALANMEFACEEGNINDSSVFIEKAQNSVKTIQKQIEFSKDYQDMGGKPPKWQNIEQLIERCVTSQNVPPSVNVTTSLSGVEIYADPMLEKVFCNLIGNTLMHAGRVTEINVSYREREDHFRIIYSDNGSGIPDEKKELIFRAGYGSNQGFGLYLVKEILSITGIEIKETGIPGKGTEFELKIPKTDFKT
ncbi:PAS domain S-box-containing protein [Methanomicrobium sp. W14]|uniref:PAS domain-containing protein n=1 Tax=Methanomicrobium sp. W14 TaxID=2817839 RepID=UPI001AE64757|nr:PAS domain S-box protein [Methanomicrobium sp. W14]MBP2133854.1 PAS domain S-box-containing protein [Methanomicrobium sp. W14]